MGHDYMLMNETFRSRMNVSIVLLLNQWLFVFNYAWKIIIYTLKRTSLNLLDYSTSSTRRLQALNVRCRVLTKTFNVTIIRTTGQAISIGFGKRPPQELWDSNEVRAVWEAKIRWSVEIDEKAGSALEREPIFLRDSILTESGLGMLSLTTINILD